MSLRRKDDWDEALEEAELNRLRIDAAGLTSRLVGTFRCQINGVDTVAEQWELVVQPGCEYLFTAIKQEKP